MRAISVHALGRRVGICVATRTTNPTQAELLGYGAEIILGSIFKFGVLFLIAAFLEVVSEVSVLLIVTGLLRTLSGGAHCSAYSRCLVMSVITLRSRK
jgi:accessory gene regulator B